MIHLIEIAICISLLTIFFLLLECRIPESLYRRLLYAVDQMEQVRHGEEILELYFLHMVN